MSKKLKGRIVLGADGSIGIFTDEGSFEGGVEKIEEILGLLEAAGISLDDKGVPEQHRHDHEGEGVHVHGRNQSHSHSHGG